MVFHRTTAYLKFVPEDHIPKFRVRFLKGEGNLTRQSRTGRLIALRGREEAVMASFNHGFQVYPSLSALVEGDASLLGYQGEAPQAQACGEVADMFLSASELGLRVDAHTSASVALIGAARELAVAASRGERTLARVAERYRNAGIEGVDEFVDALERAGAVRPRRRAKTA